MCGIGLMLDQMKKKNIRKIICRMIMEEIIFEYTSDLYNQKH